MTYCLQFTSYFFNIVWWLKLTDFPFLVVFNFWNVYVFIKYAILKVTALTGIVCCNDTCSLPKPKYVATWWVYFSSRYWLFFVEKFWNHCHCKHNNKNSKLYDKQYQLKVNNMYSKCKKIMWWGHKVPHILTPYNAFCSVFCIVNVNHLNLASSCITNLRNKTRNSLFIYSEPSNWTQKS